MTLIHSKHLLQWKQASTAKKREKSALWRQYGNYTCLTGRAAAAVTFCLNWSHSYNEHLGSFDWEWRLRLIRVTLTSRLLLKQLKDILVYLHSNIPESGRVEKLTKYVFRKKMQRFMVQSLGPFGSDKHQYEASRGKVPASSHWEKSSDKIGLWLKGHCCLLLSD